MTTEQLYTLAMMQLSLVILLASSRVQPSDATQSGLRYFQVSLAFDALSWFFYLWPSQIYFLMLSSIAASCNIWLLLAFAAKRCGKHLNLLWLLPPIVIQSSVYTLLNDLGLEQETLHFMTGVTALVALPSAWLFWFVKPHRTVSDQAYALVMLAWLGVCILRTLTLQLHPDWMLSGYLVSQALWPGVMAAYGLFAVTSYLEEAQNRLKTDAMMDPLTGQLNRRGLQDAVHSCLAYLARHEKPAAILMIDLDHFKQINDHYGHETGDLVLVKVAHELKTTLRQSDVLARLGGEEFLVFLPMTDAGMAAHTAERLRQCVANMRWAHMLNGNYRQTVSIGVSLIGPNYDFTQQLKAADQALYVAKEQGRNRVQFAPIQQEADAT
jgi:diguanylate cyclase (GGDEF)-like protein